MSFSNTWSIRTAVVLFLGAASCGRPSQSPLVQQEHEASLPIEDRGVQRSPDPATSDINTGPIDWQESAGVFIGIENFRSGADPPAEVRFAAGDAIDLAALFIQELGLPASRTVLLLAGRPDKAITQTHLEKLRAEARVIVDSQDPSREPVDAEAIYGQIEDQAQKVGPNGILVLFIATHGFTTAGQHILLTPEASISHPQGAVLAKMMQHARIQRGGRILLLVDACREHIEQADPQAMSGSRGPDSRTAWPARALEDLQMPACYAVMLATGPGGWALPNETTRNGYFTSAVLEGLRCSATLDPDGFVTLSALNSYVSQRVSELTKTQLPEGRFGLLGSLQLVHCRPRKPVGEILFPKPDAIVSVPQGWVEVDVSQPELFATVLLCAEGNGVCYSQNPGYSPVPTLQDRVTRISVQYGREDSFQIYVALSSDRNFLRGEDSFPSAPLNRTANRIVYWLGPITVTFTTHPRSGDAFSRAAERKGT